MMHVAAQSMTITHFLMHLSALHSQPMHAHERQKHQLPFPPTGTNGDERRHLVKAVVGVLQEHLDIMQVVDALHGDTSHQTPLSLRHTM